MIRTAEHLTIFIKDALRSRKTCRVYQDALDMCWYSPGKGDARKAQHDQVHAFASQNGWKVQVHTPGGYGLVADFEEAAEA